MSHDSKSSSTAGYAAEADRLAVRYESFSFADVHRGVAHGLELAHRGTRADTQRRVGVDWTVLALRRPA